MTSIRVSGGRALTHPGQLSHAITETSITVWCDFAQKVAATNYDGGTHFCQFCGSTVHGRVSTAGWATRAQQADHDAADR